MFTDLKTYTTNIDDFKYIRLAIDSMVEAKPLDQSSRTVSAATGTDSQSGKSKLLDGKVAVSFACIPFIGMAS
jgi:Gdp/GTP exchange factor required for growth at low temperatures